MNKLVIAGDIGGTKTLLRLHESDGLHQQCLHHQRYNSADFNEFGQLFQDFIQQCLPYANKQPVSVCCLGVAGPINQRTARVTNLPWLIDADALQQQFGISQVSLLNDFTAVGYGIDMLQQEDFRVLQHGVEVEQATRAVIGAGTGLGEGYLVWQGGQYLPLPSEGGHTDYAPLDNIQVELLKYLQARYGHVSYERVVSGHGLVNVYEFLACTRPVSEVMQQAMHDGTDRAALIAEYALAQKDAVAMAAMDIFITGYGAQAGNLALTCLARGGVYIAGGIAPKVLPLIEEGGFMQAFCAKGRFESLMKSLPVKVVMNPDVGLYGALRLALKHLSQA